MNKTVIQHPSFEKVIIADNTCFSTEEVYGEALKCVYHYHPEYELTYIVKGYGTRLIGTSLEHYGPGDLVLIGGNILHHYASTPSAGPIELTMSRVIKFREDCLGKGFLELEEAAAVRQLFELAKNGVAFTLANPKVVSEQISALFHASGMRRIILFLSLMNDLTAAEKRCLSYNHAPPCDHFEIARINNALIKIDLNLNQKITLRQVAKSAGLAPAVFSRFFSRVVRTTFSRYILERRINNACSLLLGTARPVTDICYDVGFCNLSNFNRLFRKVKGMTPREYRNLAKQAMKVDIIHSK
jgi:AraC-like DNA-binding protein